MDVTGIKWGTEAHHRLGDISRPSGDYFHADSEDDDNYFGQWVTGFGFVQVRFPKSGVRELTDAERETLAGQRVVLG